MSLLSPEDFFCFSWGSRWRPVIHASDTEGKRKVPPIVLPSAQPLPRGHQCHQFLMCSSRAMLCINSSHDYVYPGEDTPYLFNQSLLMDVLGCCPSFATTNYVTMRYVVQNTPGQRRCAFGKYCQLPYKEVTANRCLTSSVGQCLLAHTLISMVIKLCRSLPIQRMRNGALKYF